MRGRIFYRALQPPGSWSAWAAATKRQGPMAYKQQTLLSHSSVSWKSEVREAAWASSAASPLLGVRLPTSPYILTWRGPRGTQAHPGLQEDTAPIREGPAFITSPKPNHLPEMPFVRRRGSTYGFGGTQAFSP